MSLIAIAGALVVVAILLMTSLNPFAGGTAAGGRSSGSILSQSPAENQIKLCAEGRASTYGDPPTQAQQAWCTQQLAGQIGGVPAVP
ncbi:MAG TPA: hypothetical protein VEI83_09550 [Acidimicrobiales bacterium]|nr:hypothetical protein [Acidimicrobiales bacterium]